MMGSRSLSVHCMLYVSESLLKQLESLKAEVHKLKCEKLDLLKQTLVSTSLTQ